MESFVHTEPLVSVIIPVYNTEKYLNECVDSVLYQTYQNFEIFLIDDGSTDKSADICDDYALKDERIKTIHKSNGGQSSARNVALNIAKGKYIYFLDSDDYIANTLLELLVKTAENNYADFVFFEAQSFMDSENTLDNGVIKHFDYVRIHDYECINAQKQLVSLMNNQEYYVCTPLHFYKKEYLDRYSIRFKEGIIHEDNLFSASIYLHDGISVHLYENGYFRRLRDQSTMTTEDDKQLFYKYNSLLTVYYGVSGLIKNIQPDETVFLPLINDSINAVIYAFDNLDSQNKQVARKTFLRIKRHALIHYGKYDYELARKCAGIMKPLLRATHGVHLIIQNHIKRRDKNTI